MNSSKRILIAGGSGLVGKHLTNHLKNIGHEVAWLSRKATQSASNLTFVWDPKAGYVDPKALEFADVIVNLAGAGVADHRWTKAYKKEMIDSRVQSTETLVKAIQSQKHHVETYVSASAIGYYGNQTGTETAETAPAADTFLAQLCVDWEQAVQPIAHLGIRTSIIRVGVVLAGEGGFIPQVAAPIKWGVGAALGNGKQFTSWIHINDLVGIFTKAITDNSWNGIYNGVAPNPETNASLTKLMAKQLNRPILLPPVPVFALRILFGEMANMLVGSQHISAQKAIQSGYSFTYTRAEDAIRNLLNKQ